MNDNEIIKALREMVGKYNFNDEEWQTIEFAIAEINRTQEENEQLKEENEVYKKVNFLIASKRNELEAENEIQKAEIEKYRETVGELGVKDGEVVGLLNGKETKYINKEVAETFKRMAIKTAKAEAVKEFAERFLEVVHNNHYLLSDRINSNDYGMFTAGIEQAVNEIKKEMGCE